MAEEDSLEAAVAVEDFSEIYWAAFWVAIVRNRSPTQCQFPHMGADSAVDTQSEEAGMLAVFLVVIQVALAAASVAGTAIHTADIMAKTTILVPLKVLFDL